MRTTISVLALVLAAAVPAQSPTAAQRFRVLWPAVAADILESSYELRTQVQIRERDELRSTSASALRDLAESLLRLDPDDRAARLEAVSAALFVSPQVEEVARGDVVDFVGYPSYRHDSVISHRSFGPERSLESYRYSCPDREGMDEHQDILSTAEFVLYTDELQKCVHVLQPGQWRCFSPPSAMFGPLPFADAAATVADYREVDSRSLDDGTGMQIACAPDGLPVLWMQRNGKDKPAVVTAVWDELDLGALLVDADQITLTAFVREWPVLFPKVMVRLLAVGGPDPDVPLVAVQRIIVSAAHPTTGEARLSVPENWRVYDKTRATSTGYPADASRREPTPWGSLIAGDAPPDPAIEAAEKARAKDRRPSDPHRTSVAEIALLLAGVVGLVALCVILGRRTAVPALLVTLGIVTAACGDATTLEQVHDFGVVEPTTDRFWHEFIVHNPDDVPLVIDAITKSCGCLTTDTTAFTIAPRSRQAFRIGVRIGGISGHFSQAAVLRSGKRMVATLRVEGSVVRSYKVSPRTMDLGSAVTGAGFARQVVFSGTALSTVRPAPSELAVVPLASTREAKSGVRTCAFEVEGRRPERTGPFEAEVTFEIELTSGKREVYALQIRGEVVSGVRLDRATARLGAEKRATVKIFDGEYDVADYEVTAPSDLRTSLRRVDPQSLALDIEVVGESAADVGEVIVTNAKARLHTRVVYYVAP